MGDYGRSIEENPEIDHPWLAGVEAFIRRSLPLVQTAIGAWFLNGDTELVMKSRRVIPTRLTQAGFQFKYPTWPEAARDLASRLSSSNH